MIIETHAPQPIVRIYSPLNKDNPKLEFGVGKNRQLQGYSWNMSVKDIRGGFSLQFFPETSEIVDIIETMDIVEIYEIMDDAGEYQYPSFTGVINRIQYSATAGVQRQLHVNGYHIAGLIDEFKISMDMQAMAITKQIAGNKNIENELTTALLKSDNQAIKVKDAIYTIWESFLRVSGDYAGLSNPKIAKIIELWMGSEPFIVDNSEFHYPIAAVFYGQNTQSFQDIIKAIVAPPVYEFYSYQKGDRVGIQARINPFSKDKWKDLPALQVKPERLKNYSIMKSNEELYTIFFAYLDGYPVQMDKAIVLAANRITGLPGVKVYKEKYELYGYRPLYINMRGYYKSAKDDASTDAKLEKLNEDLLDWYGNVELMFSGNLGMTGHGVHALPGEKVKFMGGEFYVNSVQKRWRYNGSLEADYQISRGGVYQEGEFSPLKGVSKQFIEWSQE